MYLHRLSRFFSFVQRSFSSSSLVGQSNKLLIPPNPQIRKLAGEMKVSDEKLLSVCRKIEQNPELELESVVSEETAEIVALEMDLIPVFNRDTSKLSLRPPIVTIMGHVDHGKTTLLDSFRNSNICAGEHGGITQGIGAFSMKTSSGGDITFIDTPGHMAFSKMRARGAEVTDIVVLVVCAAEGVQPQTLESIEFATEAEVPIIVAINKIDLPGANIQRVELELVEAGLELDKFGGEVLHVPISAKVRRNLSDLEEAILFKAELMELHEETQCKARGVILESEFAQGKGNVCSVIIKKGTLKPGDIVVAGKAYGKVRQMVNEKKQQVNSAGPSQAVEIWGLKDLPEAGDDLLVLNDLQKAKIVSDRRRIEFEKELLSATKQEEIYLPKITFKERKMLRSRDTSKIVERLKKEVSEIIDPDTDDIQQNHPAVQMAKRGSGKSIEEQLEQISTLFEEKDEKSLNIILKAQNWGMLETLEESVTRLSEEKDCNICVVSKSVGNVTEADLYSAQEFSASILCMDLRIPKSIASKASRNKTPIKSHKIIYHLLEDLEKLIRDFVSQDFEEQVLGKANIKALFEINAGKKNAQKVAGLEISEGVVARRAKYRLIREDEVVAEDIQALDLRKFKEQVREVSKGQECGLALNYADLKEGDVLVAYELKKRKDEFDYSTREVSSEEVQDK